jgi:hypothetical protein
MVVEIQACPRCGGAHHWKLTGEFAGAILLCPRVTRFYRLTTLRIDSMPNIMQHEGPERLMPFIESMHGAGGIEEKMERWRRVRRAGVWLVDEYDRPFEEVVQSYVQGLFYPAMTGACCIAEHLMNRLVLALKEYHTGSPHYRKVYRKQQKLQDWKLLIRILADWGVFEDTQRAWAEELRGLRNDCVHYMPGYDFETGSHRALELATQLVDSLFSVYERKDIFRVFEIPGEIWVRHDVEELPFVREFVLPSCSRMAAVHRIMDDDSYSEDGAPVGELTEQEFIDTRKRYQKDPDSFHDGKTPRRIKAEVNGKKKTFVVP